MSCPSIRREQVCGMNIHWVNYPLDAFLDCQQRLGLESIELWCAVPHVWLDHMAYYDATRIRHKIESCGLAAHVLTPENCTYPYQFAAKEPMAVEHAYGYFTNGIRLAAELGCDLMEVNSGWGYWDEDREEAWKRSRDMLRRLAEFAQTQGIVLVMEAVRPEESQLVTDIPSARRMFDEVGHPNLKVMVDTCAMGVAGETLDQWFDEFGSDIRHMHFIDGTPYGHLIWGDGTHSLSDFISSLNRHHYEGCLGQEITDGRYYEDPAKADARNVHNYERYFDEPI
jgi:protein FrlC